MVSNACRRRAPASSFLATALRQPRSFFGMHLAHLGVAVFVVGVTLVNAPISPRRTSRWRSATRVGVGGYRFRFNGVRQQQGPNYRALVGDIDLFKDGVAVRKMFPEKRNYVASSMPMTEAAIDTGFLRDVYVSLGEPIDKARPDAAWAVRVYHKPFVDWIWGGCVLMAHRRTAGHQRPPLPCQGARRRARRGGRRRGRSPRKPRNGP
jgi:cytochrome c-type biogenesis protein CcmF